MAGRRDPDPSANGGGRGRRGRTATQTVRPRQSAGGNGNERPTVSEPPPEASHRPPEAEGTPKATEEAAAPPDMTELYRRLLGDLTERFGGSLDDANADAIAYAAAELYHRDFEPRLWQEKSAHDLLDLFGIPRAGVFAPYSLSDRLMLFQQRSSQAQYVTRAHELLDTLGVARRDGDGKEQPLKWRLDQVLVSVKGESHDDATPAAQLAEAAVESVDGQTPPDLKEDVKAAVEDAVEEAVEEAAAEEAAAEETAAEETTAEETAAEETAEEQALDTGLVENTSPDDGAFRTGDDTTTGVQLTDDAPVEPDTERDEPVEQDRKEDEEAAQGDEAEADGEGPEDDLADASARAEELVAELADTRPNAEPETAAPEEPGPSRNGAEQDIQLEASPGELMDAVRALEQAVEVEAELAKSPGGGSNGGSSLDLVGLTDTLNGIQGEIVAVRELIEAFEIGMRRQLDALQAQINAVAQANGQGRAQFSWPSMEEGNPSAPGPTVVARPTDPTRLMSPLADDGEADLDEQAKDAKEASLGRRSLRRVLLLMLLILIGLLIAGGVVLAVTVGWDSIRSEVTGLLAPGL